MLVALKRRNAVAEQHPDAVLGVQVAIDRADLGTEHPLKRHRHRLDDRHLKAFLARGRRELGTDPAGPDDRNSGA